MEGRVVISHVVYRFYSAAPELLYVGCTGNLNARLAGHKSDTTWHREIATITVAHYDSAAEAKAAEKAAIAAEHPKYNVVHKVGAKRQPSRRRQREAVDKTFWPTFGLVVNPSCFTELLRLERVSEQDVAQAVDLTVAELRDRVESGHPWRLIEVEAISIAIGGDWSVEALVPNRDPHAFVWNGSGFSGVRRRPGRTVRQITEDIYGAAS